MRRIHRLPIAFLWGRWYNAEEVPERDNPTGRKGETKTMKFYICRHCGNVIAFVKNTGVPVMCCGEKMQEIVPGSVDAAAEKHVPVIKTEGQKVTVSVGSVAHPMQEEHYIEWIALHTKQGNQRKELKPGMAPEVSFMLCEEDEPVAAYAYCNLHGLWKAEV